MAMGDIASWAANKHHGEGAILTGKVFISCGMASSGEQKAALLVRDLLKNKFGLTPYVAITVQSLDDVMTITKELRSSDYYL